MTKKIKAANHKKVTIYDVAKLANTSTATVSRILNNVNYPVSDALRDRVKSAIIKLDYTPNLIGRQLKTSENKEIGVIVPNISNQYYPLLLLGIEDVARVRGYNVLLCNSHRDAQNERKYLEIMYQKQVGGIILSSVSDDHEYLTSLINKGFKIVSFEQDIPVPCSKIHFNYYEGGYMAVKHLIDLGHKEIGFISSPMIKHSRKQVYEGLLAAFKEYGMPVVREFIYISDIEDEKSEQIYEFKNGEQLARRAITNGRLPSAFLCINDMTAFGVIREFEKNGIRVPEDISVIGFDNIPTSAMISPPLTTINQCTYEMGSITAEVLINMLEEGSGKTVSITLEPSLIQRSSTREYKTIKDNSKII